jgi:hypothetical protein
MFNRERIPVHLAVKLRYIFGRHWILPMARYLDNPERLNKGWGDIQREIDLLDSDSGAVWPPEWRCYGKSIKRWETLIGNIRVYKSRKNAILLFDFRHQKVDLKSFRIFHLQYSDVERLTIRFLEFVSQWDFYGGIPIRDVDNERNLEPELIIADIIINGGVSKIELEELITYVIKEIPDFRYPYLKSLVGLDKF